MDTSANFVWEYKYALLSTVAICGVLLLISAYCDSGDDFGTLVKKGFKIVIGLGEHQLKSIKVEREFRDILANVVKIQKDFIHDALKGSPKKILGGLASLNDRLAVLEKAVPEMMADTAQLVGVVRDLSVKIHT